MMVENPPVLSANGMVMLPLSVDDDIPRATSWIQTMETWLRILREDGSFVATPLWDACRGNIVVAANADFSAWCSTVGFVDDLPLQWKDGLGVAYVPADRVKVWKMRAMQVFLDWLKREIAETVHGTHDEDRAERLKSMLSQATCLCGEEKELEFWVLQTLCDEVLGENPALTRTLALTAYTFDPAKFDDALNRLRLAISCPS